MNNEEENIVLHVKYEDVEKTFSGTVNDVWISINKFFTEFIPTFEISRKMVLTVDLQNIIKDCKNIIAFTEEGPHLLVAREKLTDNETLALQLSANYIAYRLGIIERDAVSKEELQSKLGKNSKITSTRLAELVKSEIATKTADGKYRITTFGIAQMQKKILPKIKAKTNV